MAVSVEKIYEDLKLEIIDGRYGSGEPLPEVFLAEKFGVKRAWIQKVIQRLSHDMLVEKIPNKGAFIKSISAEDYCEIFEMRLALECMAARLSARRHDGVEIVSLVQLFGSLEEKKSTDADFEIKLKAGHGLHDFIIASCGNTMIASSLKRTKIQLLRARKQRIHIRHRKDRAFKEHKDILAALQERNENMAAKKMQQHLTRSYKAFMSAVIY